jgi:hypothetical protein
LQRSVSRIDQLITLDIMQTKRVESLSDSTMALIKQTGADVRYRFDGGNVWRNDMLLNTEGIKLSLSVASVRPVDSVNHQSISVSLSGKVKQDSVKISNQISVPWSGREEFLKSAIGIQ